MKKYKVFIVSLLVVILIILNIIVFTACSSDVHAHDFGDWNIVDIATCEKMGGAERICKICGKIEKENLPKAEHSYINDQGYAATCTSTGLTDGIHCSVCGEVLLKQQEIPKTQHILEKVDGKESNFDNTGLTDGKRCSICKEVIVEQNVIEKLREEDYGYKVSIGTDEHVSVYVFPQQDYDVEPVMSNTAFSRDSSSGELLKDGNGQLNFELRFDDGYYLKDIAVSSGYKAIKTPVDTGRPNTYRITKITNELIMFVSSQKQVELLDFASVTDNDGNTTFSWTRDLRVEHIVATVSKGEVKTDYVIEGHKNNWTFAGMEAGVQYDFEFTPYSYENIAGTANSCSRYYNPEIKSLSFPRIEISTQNNIWPTCEYVQAPEGCNGAGIINNKYKNCIVNLYNQNNDCIYTSSDNENYAEAKIKIRGNTSAYTEKKPYKIRLNKKADLLAELLPNRANKTYSHKDWLLLKSGNNLNTLVGWSVSETLQMDYTPAYSYVACYVNGDYRGLYILCESVSQGNGSGEEQSRCAVDDDGYIVECDAYWWNEDLHFKTPLNHSAQRYTFKYPDSDDINVNSVEYNYIFNYITEFELALKDEDDKCFDYIDVSSFAKWLIAHDILGDGDPAGSNIYLTKKDSSDNSKLIMGPLWDFDSIGMCVEKYAYIHFDAVFYYQRLFNFERFSDEYRNILFDVKDKVISDVQNNIAKINAQSYNALIDIENARWGTSYRHIEQESASLVSRIQRQTTWLINEVSK